MKVIQVSLSIRNFTYEKKLNNLNRRALEIKKRRARPKIRNRIKPRQYQMGNPTIQTRSDRRNQLIREKYNNCLQRFNFFNNMMVRDRNSLPDNISETLN